MGNPEYPYRESLLQWIWQELEFDTQHLKTVCEKKIEIIDPGQMNHGAGPDFSGAVLRIGALKVYGDVEVHILPGHWNAHHHSASKLYNRVCLHVAFAERSNTHSEIKRPDGTEPPLLLLEPYLQKSLRHLFKKHKNNPLPCSGNVSFINQEAFERQVQKAHRSYFEYKTNRLLQFYDSHLPVSAAWKKMFTAGVFDTLGIPLNRGEMVQLHSQISFKNLPERPGMFADHISNQAFQNDSCKQFYWNTTGMRPHSRPQKRVKQAAAIFYSTAKRPFSAFLSTGLKSWDEILQVIPNDLQPGRQMKTILRQTIFYPATYLLGEFLHAQDLKNSAYEAWSTSRGGVPESVEKPFKESGFDITKRTRTLGLAHQLKRYCRPGNCHKCEVFKKAISP